MRADADFMVFVVARWPALVREAVRLGVRPEDAQEATAEALARCRRGWGRASQEEDVDALVHDELARAAGRRPGTDPRDREEQARQLLVLAPPTLEDLRHREGLRRRTALRRAAVLVVPLVLVGAGAGVWTATTGDDERPPPSVDSVDDAAVAREENPAPGVVWYADGQLHLAHSVLAIEGLEDMTRIGTGVVYGDDEGRVVYAADDGGRALLGHKDPELPVAATAESGWAAWVETGGDHPEVVVSEVTTGRRVAKVSVGPEARVVAVDDQVVYYVDAAGAHSLVPAGSPGFRMVNPRDLLDVRSRIQVFQLDPDTIDVVQSYFSVEYHLPGRGARLSPDGTVVGTRLPGTDGEVALYDARSGQAFLNGLTDDDSVLDFAPGDLGTVAYVLAPDGLTPGRELQLRTCDLRTTLCHIAARIPNNGGTPVLAR
jgi:hypothetical protein